MLSQRCQKDNVMQRIVEHQDGHLPWAGTDRWSQGLRASAFHRVRKSTGWEDISGKVAHSVWLKYAVHMVECLFVCIVVHWGASHGQGWLLCILQVCKGGGGAVEKGRGKRTAPRARALGLGGGWKGWGWGSLGGGWVWIRWEGQLLKESILASGSRACQQN